MRSQRILIVIALMLILVACTGNNGTPTQYNGITLSQPEPVKGFPTQPPPVWLVVNTTAVPATYGSFCYEGACADMAPPQQLPDLAIAQVPADKRPIVIIDAATIKSVQARIGTWTTTPTAPFDPTATHNLPTEVKQDGPFVVVTLPLFQDSPDQLLAIEVTFNEGTSLYLWRLASAK